MREPSGTAKNRRGRAKCFLPLSAAVLCATLQLSACATTEYRGYGGYHTYGMDKTAKTRMIILAAAFAPVMSLPTLYFLNKAYIHNDNLHNIFTLMGFDGFFTKIGGILPK